MINKSIFYLLIFFGAFASAQTFSGRVLDAQTNKPIASVAVYFDNTTIGTTTNDNGEFSIDYSDAIQSTLVISFLGFETVLVDDYRLKNNVTIYLKEEIAQLDTVVINADDGMSRDRKLRWFRKEFLGVSQHGKSCRILNEEDLRFRFDRNTNVLTAWSNTPVIVKNSSLQYEVSFDIIDFEILIGKWNAQQVIYTGTSFYKDLDPKPSRKTSRNRNKAYKGSVLHFIRALYNKRLVEEEYIFGIKGFKVKPYQNFIISEADKEGYKTVKLVTNLDIFYKDLSDSTIQVVDNTTFQIDKYGNYSPIETVLFGGTMGGQRIGDSLPLDFGLSD